MGGVGARPVLGRTSDLNHAQVVPGEEQTGPQLPPAPVPRRWLRQVGRDSGSGVRRWVRLLGKMDRKEVGGGGGGGVGVVVVHLTGVCVWRRGDISGVCA